MNTCISSINGFQMAHVEQGAYRSLPKCLSKKEILDAKKCFKGDNFRDFLFAFLQADPVRKVVCSKWKEVCPFNPSLAEHSMPCLSKQCRSRSVGFRLIWICTVCHLICEFLLKTRIKKSDWLQIRSGRGILIYSARQGLK